MADISKSIARLEAVSLELFEDGYEMWLERDPEGTVAGARDIAITNYYHSLHTLAWNVAQLLKGASK